MQRNAYETAARARKVAALLLHVPGSGDAVANRLSVFTQRMREVFAAGAGVNAPSDRTWAQLVEAVRARRAVA